MVVAVEVAYSQDSSEVRAELVGEGVLSYGSSSCSDCLGSACTGFTAPTVLVVTDTFHVWRQARHLR